MTDESEDPEPTQRLKYDASYTNVCAWQPVRGEPWAPIRFRITAS